VGSQQNFRHNHHRSDRDKTPTALSQSYVEGRILRPVKQSRVVVRDKEVDTLGVFGSIHGVEYCAI
jgi:hypothetical protein